MHNFSYSNANQLLKFLKYLNNFTLGDIAFRLSIALPNNLRKNKGFIGKLIENFLGLRVNNKVQQDVPNLGVELKIISLVDRYTPSGNISICSVPLIKNTGLTWKYSYFYKKIKKILWVPILKDNSGFIKNYKIIYPFLWTPSYKDLKILRQDWEECMDLVVLGQVENIHSKFGQFLQVSIKSKNKRTCTKGIGKFGEVILTNPRSFYFRKNFISSILKEYI